MKTRLTSTVLAVLTGVGLVAAVAACTPQIASAEVGECVNMEDLTGDITNIPVLECTEEHDAQVIGKFDMDLDGEYPGAEAIEEQAIDGCSAAYETFVGIPYAEATLRLQYVSPSQESWDASDREILCIAYTSDGTTVTESWEGAAI